MSQEINVEFVNEDGSSPTVSNSSEDDYTTSTSSNDYTTETATSNYTEDTNDYRENESKGNSESYSSITGDFKVVAGVFGKYRNAEKRLNKLLNLGFSETKILSIGDSDKYTVVVKRVTNMEDAQQYVEDLKANSIRSFVKS